MTAIALRPRAGGALAREMLAEKGCATRGARVLVIGVTYKPGVADVRESPAMEIIEGLAAAGAVVEYVDPWVDHLDTPYRRLTSHPAPERDAWDLVLVHTRHAGVELGWLTGHLVLDPAARARARSTADG